MGLGLFLYSPFRGFEFFSHGTKRVKQPLYSDFRVKTNSFPLGTKLLPRSEGFSGGTKLARYFRACRLLTKKVGRPAKEATEPPMPASWKDTERLAVCLAYLEASEKGAATPDVLDANTDT